MTPQAHDLEVGPDGPVYLTTAEVAARFRTAPSSVRDWRSHGTGPLGIRFGKNVLYPLPEVEAWERRQIEAAKREHRRKASPLESVPAGARSVRGGGAGSPTPVSPPGAGVSPSPARHRNNRPNK